MKSKKKIKIHNFFLFIGLAFYSSWMKRQYLS